MEDVSEEELSGVEREDIVFHLNRVFQVLLLIQVVVWNVALVAESQELAFFLSSGGIHHDYQVVFVIVGVGNVLEVHDAGVGKELDHLERVLEHQESVFDDLIIDFNPDSVT